MIGCCGCGCGAHSCSGSSWSSTSRRRGAPGHGAEIIRPWNSGRSLSLSWSRVRNSGQKRAKRDVRVGKLLVGPRRSTRLRPPWQDICRPLANQSRLFWPRWVSVGLRFIECRRIPHNEADSTRCISEPLEVTRIGFRVRPIGRSLYSRVKVSVRLQEIQQMRAIKQFYRFVACELERRWAITTSSDENAF